MMYVKALLLSLGLWGGSTCDFNQPSNATCQLNERFSDPCSDDFAGLLFAATILATSFTSAVVALKSDQVNQKEFKKILEQQAFLENLATQPAQPVQAPEAREIWNPQLGMELREIVRLRNAKLNAVDEETSPPRRKSYSPTLHTVKEVDNESSDDDSSQ